MMYLQCKMCRELFLLFSVFVLTIYGQSNEPVSEETQEKFQPQLSTRIGNFSLELLYHTSKTIGENENFVISPVTIWKLLLAIAEGAHRDTLQEIKSVIRAPTPKYIEKVRNTIMDIEKILTTNTSTVRLKQGNTIFIDAKHFVEKDYKSLISTNYGIEIKNVNFGDATKTADLINEYMSHVTKSILKSIVNKSVIADADMILASAMYFKGQWSSSFNSSWTALKPFYDSNGRNIGEVNMMRNIFTYSVARIPELQARVIELPYGVQNRLSMLIMLPDRNVNLENMFLNFVKKSVTLDKVFSELKIAQEEFTGYQVDCYIPRFKIESDITLNAALKKMGIFKLFDASNEWLDLARTPALLSKFLHKVEIEVTEEGAKAPENPVYHTQAVVLEVNRPFAYIIIEKTTNIIVLGGLFQQPLKY